MIMRMDAICAHAVEEAMEVSQSLANRRQRPSHSNVLSTTHRRGRSWKPFAVSDRLMIARVHLPTRSATTPTSPPRSPATGRHRAGTNSCRGTGKPAPTSRSPKPPDGGLQATLTLARSATSAQMRSRALRFPVRLMMSAMAGLMREGRYVAVNNSPSFLMAAGHSAVFPSRNRYGHRVASTPTGR